jgi:hypothetical protein
MAYTLDTAIALDTAGLTLSAQLVNSTGANVGSAVTTGFVDFGSGYYLWHYEAFPDGHRGAVKFSAGGVLKAVKEINPEEVEAGAAALPPGAQVNYVGPVAQTGEVVLIRGDDYSNADGRALPFLEAANPVWPALAGATVTFKAVRPTEGGPFSKEGTVVAATTPKEVRFELTSAETLSLLPGKQGQASVASSYEVEATLSSGRVVTLSRGALRIEVDIR